MIMRHSDAPSHISELLYTSYLDQLQGIDGILGFGWFRIHRSSETRDRLLLELPPHSSARSAGLSEAPSNNRRGGVPIYVL